MYKRCKICGKLVEMKYNDLRCSRCRASVDKELGVDSLKDGGLSEIDKLRDENRRLKREVSRLRKLLEEKTDGKAS